MKRKAIDWEKIFGNHIIYKGLYLEYIRISWNSIIRKQTIPKIWADMKRHSPKDYIQMRDARKYHNDMSYHYICIFWVVKAKQTNHDNSCQDSRASGTHTWLSDHLLQRYVNVSHCNWGFFPLWFFMLLSTYTFKFVILFFFP